MYKIVAEKFLGDVEAFFCDELDHDLCAKVHFQNTQEGNSLIDPVFLTELPVGEAYSVWIASRRFSRTDGGALAVDRFFTMGSQDSLDLTISERLNPGNSARDTFIYDPLNYLPSEFVGLDYCDGKISLKQDKQGLFREGVARKIVSDLSEIEALSEKFGYVCERFYENKSLSLFTIGRSGLDAIFEVLKMASEDESIDFSLVDVLSLDIASCRLGELPKWVCEFSKLKRLDLSENYLADLPDSLGNLPLTDGIRVKGNLKNMDDVITRIFPDFDFKFD